MRRPASVAAALLILATTAPAARFESVPACDDPPGLLGSQDALDGLYRRLRPVAARCAERTGLPPPLRARLLVESARMSLAVGDAPSAARSLRAALAAVPDDPAAAYWLARAERDRPDEAIAPAERAAARATTPRGRADALRLTAEIRLDLGDRDGARRDAAAAAAASPGDLDAWAVLGRAASEDRPAAARAAERAETAAAQAPPWLRPAAFRLCARIRLDAQDAPGAAADLRRALADDPDDIDALETLVSLRDGRLAAPAVAVPAPVGRPPTETGLREDLRRDPDDLAARGRLIELLRARAPAQAAAEAARFQRSIEEAPEWQRGPALLWIAGAWADLGDRTRATSAFTRAQDYDWRTIRSAAMAVRLGRMDGGPRIQFLYQTAAAARASLGDAAGAERDLRLAADAAPAAPEPWGELARLALESGRFDEALEDSDRQLERLPDGADRTGADRLRDWILRARRGGAEPGPSDERGLEERLRAAPDDLEARAALVERVADPRRALALLAGPAPSEKGRRGRWLALRAAAEERAGDRVGARRDLDAAMDLDPRALCAEHVLRSAPPDLSLPFFDRCLEAFPDDPTLASDRGVARASAGDRDGAVADFRRALARDPDLLAARLSLASVLASPALPQQYKEKPPAHP